ncbi:hypothetical protein [Acidianus hospitalis]|uniref:hypothetical protein n=1 Tax=Acidianus hospitalis TaxID=563177 RepID=UPI0016513C40|nr:hypothetical protein [Acidianus hospitalis]
MINVKVHKRYFKTKELKNIILKVKKDLEKLIAISERKTTYGIIYILRHKN